MITQDHPPELFHLNMDCFFGEQRVFFFFDLSVIIIDKRTILSRF